MGRDYLRKRPFLVVRQITTPSENARTENKGWAKAEGATVVQELIEIVDAVRDKHMVGSVLVLDILKQKTVKNTVSPEHDGEVIQYYLEKYKRELAEGVQIWMHKISADPEEAKRIVEAIEKDIEIKDDK